MPLTRQTEYAMHTIRYLAEVGPHSRSTAHCIANDTGIPESFLPHVISALSKAGLIKTVRGWHGGTSLTRHPADISMLAVIEAVHGPYIFYQPTLKNQAHSCITLALLDIENDLVNRMRQITFFGLRDDQR